MNVTFTFKTSKDAWSFMRACDDAGLMAGFPSLTGEPTVLVVAAHAEAAKPLVLAHGGV